ncbi:MAG TPA: nuclear transport factor 2 family protein [Candidatus Angelobacter sp.]
MANRSVWITLLLASLALAQQPQPTATPGQAAPAKAPEHAAVQSPLERLLEGKVKTEWEAFKNKDKKTYSDLLADDFIAIEDDTQGMRNKTKAAAEIDSSVINSYNLFAFRVLPLNSNAALVTYELTMLFPPKAQVRFKRVLISELWLKREGQWKMRYYQETRVR